MSEVLAKTTPLEQNTIFFNHKSVGEPILKLCPNGDIFVKGKLIENDIEVVEALREFINLSKCQPI